MKWSLSRWFSSRPSPANKSNVAPRRLKLEALEERAVPATLHVTNMTSDNAATVGTLRYEINHSATGDTIKIDVAGTLQLIAANGNLGPSHALTIIGLGPNQDIIKAGGNQRIFRTNSALTLSGLTMTGANTNSNGAAVTDFGGLLTIDNCNISGNTARNYGAAIDATRGLTITNSTISGNKTTQGSGGGIYARGTTKIVNCTISGNSGGTGNGGGLDFAGGGSLTITASTVSGNTASKGAGVFAYSNIGNSTITNSTITGNKATGAGGGIAVQGTGTLNLVNDTIVGNKSANGGGLSVGNVGLFPVQNIGSLTVNVLNTIVANNTDTSQKAPDIAGKITARNSLIFSQTGITFVGSKATDIFGVDPHLGPLQNNGGPTMTMALLAGSIAIDAGDDSVLGLPYSLTTDQRGLARKAGSHVDIGAFESQLPHRRGRIF